jgi:hypothetical protein
MFLSAYLAILCSQLPVDARAGENKLTQLEIKASPSGLSFEWADADEALRGSVRPQARVGRTFTVSATLQPLAGPDFEGPVTFAFRPLEEVGATETVTVTRKPGEKAWVASFTPTSAVDHRLEVSWRSTHHKVVRGVIPVGERSLPEWLTWLVGGGLVAIAVAIGLWVLFGRKEQTS